MSGEEAKTHRVWGIALLLAAWAAFGVGPVVYAEEGGAGVPWRAWEKAQFERADREGRLILLDITAVWCHWCHVLDRETYRDAGVIRLIREKYIPIRVDADRRPDIQERYGMGGLPTIAFLTPEGHILFGKTGFIAPGRMRRLLRQVDAAYQANRKEIRLGAKTLMEQLKAEEKEAGAAETPVWDEVVERALQLLRSRFDREFGGFGRSAKFPKPDAVRLALLKAHEGRAPFWMEVAEKTLAGWGRLLDPVWGGFYRYATRRDWSAQHFEKLLGQNAELLDVLIQAYHATEKAAYRDAADAVVRYVRRFLTDPAGGFYGSQDADVGVGTSRFMEGKKYFGLGDSVRLEVGVPHVDRTIFADANGRMASAFLRAYRVLMDEAALKIALRALDFLWVNLWAGEGVRHFWTAGKRSSSGFLSDQVSVGRAFLEAYGATGERRYLDRAKRVAEAMVRRFWDARGGFSSRPRAPGGVGLLAHRERPLGQNAAAARFFTDLHHVTGEPRYLELAEKTLRRFLKGFLRFDVDAASGYALAVDRLRRGPVQVVIVGRREDPRTAEMRRAGFRLYEPRKLLWTLDPTRDDLTIGEVTYPAQDHPVGYVCIGNVCSTPIDRPEDFLDRVRRFLRRFG